MKKPGKTSSTKSRASSDATKKTRHAKSSKPAVTIDLPAEDVSSKSKAASNSPPKATRKSSVPKTSTTKVAPSPETTSKPEAPKPAPSSTSFGRNSQPERPVQKPAAAKPKKSGSGLFGKLVAGVIGGCVALGGAYWMHNQGLIQLASSGSATGDSNQKFVSAGTFDETKSDLLARIAKLEEKLQTSASASSATSPEIDLAKINTAIDEKLQQFSANLPASTTAGSIDTSISQQVETLQSKLAATDSTVDALKSAISNGSAGDGAAITSINQQVETLSATIAEMNKDIDAIKENAASDNTIKNFQSALPQLRENVTNQITNLGEKLSDFESKLSDFKNSVTNNNDTLSSIKENLAAMVQKSAGLETKLNESTSILSDLQTQSEDAERSDKRAAQALAAAALKTAIDQGQPFGEILNTLRSVSEDPKTLDSLQAFAETGVPTQTSLITEFASVEDAVLAALEPKQEGDLTSRLLASAQKMIKIKSLDETDNSSPQGVLNQVKEALSSNNLDTAVSLWEKLPQQGRDAGSAWYSKLTARAQVNSIVAETVQSLMHSTASQ